MSHLLEPLEGVGGEVVPLRMLKDILGQAGEDRLKVGTLGSRSHDENWAIKESARSAILGEQTIHNGLAPPRGEGPVCYVWQVCAVWYSQVQLLRATRAVRLVVGSVIFCDEINVKFYEGFDPLPIEFLDELTCRRLALKLAFRPRRRRAKLSILICCARSGIEPPLQLPHDWLEIKEETRLLS